MDYKNYDPSVDYADRLRRMMQAGASAAEVERVLNQRVRKATTEPGHEQYAYDAYYTAARDYINRNSTFGGLHNTGTQTGAVSGGAASHADPYAERLESALRRLEAREPFSYDPESDPVFQSYRAAYRREGDRAAKDTLGEAAALTGGQASTAAVAAASQARDYYNSKVGDVIPALYQLAWQMYESEGGSLLSEIETLAGLSAAAYERESDRLAQDYAVYADERDFAYRQYQDVLDREDSAAQNWYDRTYDYDRLAQSGRQDAADRAYDRAMAFLNAGVMPTDQMLRAAGIDRETARSLRAAALRRHNQ